MKLIAQASTAREHNVLDHRVCAVSTNSETEGETDCTDFNGLGTNHSVQTFLTLREESILKGSPSPGAGLGLQLEVELVQ